MIITAVAVTLSMGIPLAVGAVAVMASKKSCLGQLLKKGIGRRRRTRLKEVHQMVLAAQQRYGMDINNFFNFGFCGRVNVGKVLLHIVLLTNLVRLHSTYAKLKLCYSFYKKCEEKIIYETLNF